MTQEKAFTRKRTEQKFSGKNKVYHWKVVLIPHTSYENVVDKSLRDKYSGDKSILVKETCICHE